MEKAMFADELISLKARPTTEGRPWPPNSARAPSAGQPPVTRASYAALKPVGVVTAPPACHVQPCLSPTRLSGARTSVDLAQDEEVLAHRGLVRHGGPRQGERIGYLAPIVS